MRTTPQTWRVEGADRNRVGMAKGRIDDCGEPGDRTVHDGLYGGVAWIEGDGELVALISLDHTELSLKAADAVKAPLAAALQIAADRIVLCCSHAHACPEMDPEKLAARLTGIAREARERMEPAWMAYHRHDTGGRLTANRRARVAFGSLTAIYHRGLKTDIGAGTVDAREQVHDFVRYGLATYAPGYRSAARPAQAPPPSPEARALLDALPDRLYLDGPVDPDLEVVDFRGRNGASLGSLVRFSCHPIIFQGDLEGQHSADYPGVLTREISAATGSPALFLNGPSGDVSPVYASYGAAEVERFGRELASRIAPSIPGLAAQPLTRLTFARRRASFRVAPDMRGVSHERFLATEREFAECAAGAFDPRILHQKHDAWMRAYGARYYGHTADRIRPPITLIGLNDLAVLFLPGEPFAEVSLALKRRFPGHRMVVVELADGDDPGYVPTREEFQRGGFEVACSALEPGAAERMVSIASRMLRRFRRRPLDAPAL